MKITVGSRQAHGMAACAIALTVLVALVGCSAPSTTTTHVKGSTPPTATARPQTAEWMPGPSVPKGAEHFAVAPSDQQVAYLCTGSDTTLSPGPNLYKTSDGGATWQPLVSVPHADMPCSVFVDPSDASDLFLQQVLIGIEPPSVTEYMWRSRDGGQTWQPISMVDHTFGWSALAVVGTRIVAAAIPEQFGPGLGCPQPNAVAPAPFTRLYASEDGGETWQPLAQSIVSQDLGVLDFEMMGTTIIAQATTLVPECTTPTVSLWTSSDSGATWSKLNLPAGYIGNLPSFAQSTSGAYYGAVAIDGLDASHPNATTLLYSTDSGRTWSPLPSYRSPDKPTATVEALYSGPLVTSSGAVVIAFSLYPGGAMTDILDIWPGAASPSWAMYAPNDKPGVWDSHQHVWQVVRRDGGAAIWTLDGQTGASWYLPLP